jgi:hypothetical protein
LPALLKQMNESPMTDRFLGSINQNLPGFIAAEGFPATELREKALTRWMVSTPERVAEAIVAAGPGGTAERYVPRYYAVPAALRAVAPGLLRRVLSGGKAAALTTSTAEEGDGPGPN